MTIINPVAYILCYTIKTKTESGHKFNDFWEIFPEFDENDQSPEQQAENKINLIMKSHDFPESDSEVHTWNIAKLTKTSDHYQTEPKRPESISILVGEDAVRNLEENGIDSLDGSETIIKINCPHEKPIETIINETLCEYNGWNDFFILTYQEEKKPITFHQIEAEIIQKALWFIVQIPHDIINRAWPVNEYLIMNKHFKEKYDGFCSKDGYASANAVIKFFCDLDSTNKSIFCREIAKLIHDKTLFN